MILFSMSPRAKGAAMSSTVKYWLLIDLENMSDVSMQKPYMESRKKANPYKIIIIIFSPDSIP